VSTVAPALSSLPRTVRARLTAAADFLLRHRWPVKLFLHLFLFVLAYYLAFLVLFDFRVPPEHLNTFVHTLGLALAAKAAAFLVFGLFRGWWRYISIKDILPIAAGCTLASVLFASAVHLFPWEVRVPRSIVLLDWGNTLLLVFAVRYLTRAGREAFGRGRGGDARSVLIVGAGSAGRMIAREIRENPLLGMTAVGFIDDDRAKIGTRIQGLRVLGGRDRIGVACREEEVDEIVIALPSASVSAIRRIVDLCRHQTASFRILPGVGELLDGTASVRDLRSVHLSDLLGRQEVVLDTELIRRDITGETVMVTGAAGSIGAELCRQLARLSPARLVMFEIGESALFDLEREMRQAHPGLRLAAAIGDVRDRVRVEEVLAAHRPSIVYHAAAYKHVPVMELHPAEAVKNNVLGTRVVAEAAAEQGVRRFVLVSTDKAVRPANVMGATKRVAERIVQGMNGAGRETVFVSVRFGNVLDSVGSVVPIFRRQLETTGKLTVTHPDASRYFMLIPEAAGLILQAGAMGAGGEVFVLDMGSPVKVVDLAMNMIRLSGKELGVDAEIVFTGLRPGEKLHEELVVEGEDVIRTSHPKVMKMMGNGPVEPEWRRGLDALLAAAARGENAAVVRGLSFLVKGYTPDPRWHGIGALGEDLLAPGTIAPGPAGSLH
jgi:FlaA1/EpsC-like NDP-sugar epimerase